MRFDLCRIKLPILHNSTMIRATDSRHEHVRLLQFSDTAQVLRTTFETVGNLTYGRQKNTAKTSAVLN